MAATEFKRTETLSKCTLITPTSEATDQTPLCFLLHIALYTYVCCILNHGSIKFLNYFLYLDIHFLTATGRLNMFKV